MSIKNRYISIKSPSESELAQSLLFEAGAGWQLIGQKTLILNSCIIVINDRLEMYTMAVTPHSGYKKLSLLELVNIVERYAPVENDNTYHVCKFSDNHISFEDCEVEMTIDEMSELLQVIRSLSHRDFEITTIDEVNCDSDQTFQLTNLNIHFK